MSTKLIIIFGPQAVGKMSVGKELARQCEFDILTNHGTIDLIQPLFDWNEPAFGRLNRLFRHEIMKEYAGTYKNGLIFTLVWGLDFDDDNMAVEEYASFFEANGGETYFVELSATIEERLIRNRTEERLKAKPSKRNFKHSEQLIHDWEQYKMNSDDDFKYHDHNYIKIDNTNISQQEAVAQIRERFGW